MEGNEVGEQSFRLDGGEMIIQRLAQPREVNVSIPKERIDVIEKNSSARNYCIERVELENRFINGIEKWWYLALVTKANKGFKLYRPRILTEEYGASESIRVTIYYEEVNEWKVLLLLSAMLKHAEETDEGMHALEKIIRGTILDDVV